MDTPEPELGSWYALSRTARHTVKTPKNARTVYLEAVDESEIQRREQSRVANFHKRLRKEEKLLKT